MILSEYTLFDAGIFISALLKGDSRHNEAREIVERARRGDILACTTDGILSEVYAALTWQGATPRHLPGEADEAVRLLIEFPSSIALLPGNEQVPYIMLALAEKYALKARRIHDARHAAIALVHQVVNVYTYDFDDWKIFESVGLTIKGPDSILPKVEGYRKSRKRK